MYVEQLRCGGCGEAVKPTTFKCAACGVIVGAKFVAMHNEQRGARYAIMGCSWAILLAFMLGVWAISSYVTRGPSEADIAASNATKAKAAEDKRQGLHCLIPVLGYNSSFVDAVKARLRDPDSFVHERTRIAPADKTGQHPIIMDYRARNGFGGVNRAVAVGTVDHETCATTAVELVG
jgi:hypothetical protein